MSSGNKRKLYAERLRQLQQLGYATPHEHELANSQPFGALVEQCAAPGECRVRDLGDQGTLYMVWVSVQAERPGVVLCSYRFVPPWPDTGFQTLHNADNAPPNVYILPNGCPFELGNVLNGRFGAGGWRLPLTSIEGWLFAHSLTPIPAECKYGELVEVGLEFFGKSGERLAEADSTLWVDRSIELKHKPRVVEPAEPESAAQRAQSYVEYLRNLPEEQRLRRSGLFEPWESIDHYLSSLSATGESDQSGQQETSPSGRRAIEKGDPKVEK